MLVEIPQILWHNGSDNEQNKNAPVYSVSILESGLTDSTSSTSSYGHVLATAGNNGINLWKVDLSTASDSPKIIQETSSQTKINHLCSLSRHDSAVNVIRFSPDGLHLATAGDSGIIMVYSVPHSKRGNGNGRHYWVDVTEEKLLLLKVVSSNGEGIYDLDWSSDSKRFVVGSLDHCMSIYELADGERWSCCYRNGRDHTHYIQGAAFDPKQVYVASMSCDRSVRVYARKPTKYKKKLLSKPDSKGEDEHAAFVEDTLSNSKVELGRSNLIKFRKTSEKESNAHEDASSAAMANPAPKPKKEHLFAEESTSDSFFRRLRFTVDGKYLIAPTGVWRSPSSSSDDKTEMVTYMFARHKFDQPVRVLPGLEKPSRVVCPNPVLFQKPNDPAQSRSYFMVLTETSAILYDTFHTKAVATARGLHYSGLTDATWTPNGHTALISSLDGYISILSFGKGELGTPFASTKLSRPVVTANKENEKVAVDIKKVPVSTSEEEAGPKPSITTAATSTSCSPDKPKQKKRVSPQLISPGKIGVENKLEEGAAPVVNVLQPKKKKRATLVSVPAVGK